jgi:type IV pilus assembly protein PilY1
MAVVPVASAEDIEIYTSLAATTTANPNIMFVVDTSGSMKAESEVKEPYDHKKTYAGSCASTGIYFVTDGKLPLCPDSTAYFDEASNTCDQSVVGYEADGTIISPPQDGSLLMIGTYSDQLAQFDTASNKWREISVTKTSDRSLSVECFSDSGLHGKTSKTSPYIKNITGWTGTAPADPKIPHPVWSSGAGNMQLFHGNYVNYLSDDTVPLVWRNRLEQVKSAVEIMVRGNTRIDMGLMRFDSKNNTQGGPVMYPILDVGANRNDFFSRLKTLDYGGYTPLSETYYESLLYFGGKAADYGESSVPKNQTGATYTSGGTKYYNSPISSTCDKNYIVLLSDGEPKKDDLNATRKGVLTGFNVGSCSTDITSSETDDNRDPFKSDTSTVDNCLDELAGWAATEDVAEDAAITAHDGVQNLTTHTIGFQLSDAGGVQLMTDTANKGGGGFFQASSEAELIKIFNKIIAMTLQVNTTFSSPAVSVNAFNRSTHLDDLYFTLFKPGAGPHWAGNLKKYKLDFFVDTADKDNDGDTTEKLPFIKDAVGASAVDGLTGFFSDTSKSFWTAGAADGKEVKKGGAASMLTNTRKVYTNTGSYTKKGSVYVPASTDLTATVNLLDKSNAAVTDALLATTGLSDLIAGTPYRDTLLDWAKGLDVFSKYGVINTTNDARLEMGDPLHAEPALVQYGGTVASPDLVAYVATNDGYVHAFDVDDGTEIFSFVPQELLPSLSSAMENNGSGKLYGLDGNVVAWINDANKDGTIAGAGEHVYLYISQRRGGRNIYSMDVTDRTNPKLRWVIKGGLAATDYEELGQTWSTVNVDKIKDGNAERDVLIFGGGYDPAQDGTTLKSTDGVGRTIFIADAITGERLWSAGVGGDTITDMEYSIPARVVPLDISGDGFIDRIYAADMGGQIFRFDINNTNGAALASSITGGRIADLAGVTAVDARRFYYPPDVALATNKGEKYYALVISSGYRAHPLNKVIHDRIYMIKDRDTGLTTTYKTLTEADLEDVTDNLAGGDSGAAGNAVADAAREAELALIAAAEGWYIDLDDENNPGTWIGEKGLAEPLILEGVAIVTTYTPNAFVATNSCEPNIGLGKVFFLDLLDATPAFPSNLDLRPERHTELMRGGIPPSPNVIITKGGEPTLCIGTECQAADLGLGIRKTFWYEVEQ